MARLAKSLDNRPVNDEVEYDVANLKMISTRVSYADGEHLRRKPDGEIKANGILLMEEERIEQIGYNWAFKMPKENTANSKANKLIE